jgi:hypothetical protein
MNRQVVDSDAQSALGGQIIADGSETIEYQDRKPCHQYSQHTFAKDEKQTIILDLVNAERFEQRQHTHGVEPSITGHFEQVAFIHIL